MSEPDDSRAAKRGIGHHLNAEDVLPDEVLRSVQEHFSGGRIYIPSPHCTLERDASICDDWLALRIKGEGALLADRQLADEYGLSARRIQQITTAARLRGKNRREGK